MEFSRVTAHEDSPVCGNVDRFVCENRARVSIRLCNPADGWSATERDYASRRRFQSLSDCVCICHARALSLSRLCGYSTRMGRARDQLVSAFV